MAAWCVLRRPRYKCKAQTVYNAELARTTTPVLGQGRCHAGYDEDPLRAAVQDSDLVCESSMEGARLPWDRLV
ncbi:unnamed protein product [Rangifer tarandus platyrhynchus]|uniref:Uncharacterized protein n=1 Tax=Rangifer tarandus platyrhynchus TaxID=3082113 RepID=A0ABN8XNG3_RANTA|nr:unnamed protein product [Rangifer tarandus platyrhynchus]